MAMVRRRSQLADEVSRAYYEYGKFCFNHPYATLAHSLCMVLFLSYPLLTARWFYPSPCVLVKTKNLTSSWDFIANQLAWLSHQTPIAHIFQVIVDYSYDPYVNVQYSATDALRSFYAASFELYDRVKKLATPCSDMLSPISRPFFNNSDERPVAVCRLFAPTALWNHSREALMEDQRFPACLQQKHRDVACLSELLIGMSDVPASTLNSRWQYAVTVMMIGYSEDQATILRSGLEALGHRLPFYPSHVVSDVDDTVLHVFYKIKRTLMDYILLIISYVVLLFYIYACCQKIEMVKSKRGLALVAVCTVAFSLLMAAGICIHFQLIRRTWFVELFPYLALLLGMENVLCITRSVVFTPVDLELSCRLARGLAAEGWSLTRNFCSACAVLAVGLLFSSVPEITEFCTVALVGVFVDFYMQLFFYFPCLAFDLARFGHSVKSLPSDVAAVQHSSRSVDSVTDRLHRLPVPDYLNRIFSMGRRRYFQGICMVLIAAWIAWVAVGVQHLVSDDRSNQSVVQESGPEVAQWQLYRCWADFIESLGVRVNSRFLTILRPIRLSFKIDDDVLVLGKHPVIIENRQDQPLASNLELQIGRRIASLEMRMTVVLLVTCSMFLIVGVFIFYVCFVGGRRSCWKTADGTGARMSMQLRWRHQQQMKSSGFVVQSLPVAFEPIPMEQWKMLQMVNDATLLSLSSQDCAVVWNADTGQVDYVFGRQRATAFSGPPLKDCSKARSTMDEAGHVWSMACTEGLAAFGMSDGRLRIHDLGFGGALLCENRLNGVGITDIAVAKRRLILARLDGFLDFVELQILLVGNMKNVACTPVRSVRAHSMNINCLQVFDDIVLSCSDDRTVKVCALSSCHLLHCLQAHSAPVVSMVVSAEAVGFTFCLDGTLCSWNLNSGHLLWVVDDLSSTECVVSLAVGGSILVGFCSARTLWLWSKSNGHLLSHVKPEHGHPSTDFGCLYDLPQMVMFADDMLAIAGEKGVQFWDINRKMMLREVMIDGAGRLQPIRHLRRLGAQSVVCVVANVIYRVHFPIIKV